MGVETNGISGNEGKDKRRSVWGENAKRLKRAGGVVVPPRKLSEPIRIEPNTSPAKMSDNGEPAGTEGKMPIKPKESSENLPPLHLQIASDKYWEGPVTPARDRLPFQSRLQDVFFGDAISNTVDILYRRMKDGGIHRREIPVGEELAINVPNGLLKIVQDMRTIHKKPIRRRSYASPELFDAKAQEMIDSFLYSGIQTTTQVGGPDQTVDIARRTVYLINAPSGKQLAGKQSALIGRGGGQYSVEFIGSENTVGSITRYDTRKEHVETRIVSAEVLIPGGHKKEKPVFDLSPLGAKLFPNLGPSSA